jgi:hypothetical protein
MVVLVSLALFHKSFDTVEIYVILPVGIHKEVWKTNGKEAKEYYHCNRKELRRQLRCRHGGSGDDESPLIEKANILLQRIS